MSTAIIDTIKQQTPNLLFRAGQYACYRGDIFKIRTAEPDFFVLENMETHKTQHLTTDVLYDAYIEGDFSLADDEQRAITFRPLTCEQELSEAERMLAYVNELDAQLYPGSPKTWASVVDSVSKRINDKNSPEPKQVYRALGRFKDCSRNVARFIKRSKMRSSPKLDAQMDLIMEVLDDEFLVPGGNNVSKAHEVFKTRFAEEVAKGRLEGTPISRSYFKEVIDTLDPYEVCVAQLGRKAANDKFRASDTKIVTYFMMERVEIDAVHLNLGLLDDDSGEFLGKVIVFLAIDVHTRYILGYSLVYGQSPGENSDAVIDLIKSIVTPKVDHSNFVNQWHCLGLPTTLHSDNGPGFVAESTRRYITMLGIDHHRSETGRGYRRPFIERFNRTLRGQLCESLPGYLGKRIDERNYGKTIEDMATLTVSEFVGYLEHYIVDVYHQRPHKGLDGLTPAQAVEMGLANFVPQPVPNLKDLESLRGVTKKGSIQESHGIQFQNHYFYSPELRKIRFQLMGNGSGNAKSPKVEFIFDKNDVSRITVIVPGSLELLVVPNRNPQVQPGTSVEQHKQNLEAQREQDAVHASDVVKPVRKEDTPPVFTSKHKAHATPKTKGKGKKKGTAKRGSINYAANTNSASNAANASAATKGNRRSEDDLNAQRSEGTHRLGKNVAGKKRTQSSPPTASGRKSTGRKRSKVSQ